MNGIAVITIHDGELKGEHTLRFGMLGCAEFERRVTGHTASPNNVKVLQDMIYGGLFGEAMRNENVAPEYSFAYDLLEALSNQDDYVEQSMKLQEVYEASKFGKAFIAKSEELKKKLEGLGNMIP